MVTRKKAIVVKDFHDSGTGRLFRKGETPTLSHGEYLNYFAAGLLREADIPVEIYPVVDEALATAIPTEADRPA